MTFISDLVCISMRNSGALGPAPCPRSAVPNAASPTKSVPSSCDLGWEGHPSHGAHVPPLSLGGGGRLGLCAQAEGDQNWVGAIRQKKMDICFSSRWENSPDPRD